MYFSLDGKSPDKFSIEKAVNYNRWYYVIVTITLSGENSLVSVYINGNPAGPASLLISGAVNSIVTINPISMPKVWYRALGADEVLAEYQANSSWGSLRLLWAAQFLKELAHPSSRGYLMAESSGTTHATYMYHADGFAYQEII
jgi:hypothetical protein